MRDAAWREFLAILDSREKKFCSLSTTLSMLYHEQKLKKRKECFMFDENTQDGEKERLAFLKTIPNILRTAGRPLKARCVFLRVLKAEMLLP